MPQSLLARAIPAEGTTAAYLMLPLSFGFTALHVWSEMAGSWCRLVWSPAHNSQPEGHSQLSVPDPIEIEGERDLFA